MFLVPKSLLNLNRADLGDEMFTKVQKRGVTNIPIEPREVRARQKRKRRTIKKIRLDIEVRETKLTINVTVYRRSNGRWYVRFWLNGQRRMLSTGENDYDKALLKIKEILQRARDPKASRRKPSITVAQLATEFEQYIEKRWMPSTVENDKGRLKKLRAEFGNKMVSEITEQQLTIYLKRRKDETVVRLRDGTRYEQKIDITTVKRELTTIKLLFKFAEEKGYIATNPALKTTPFPIGSNRNCFINTNERRRFTEDELNRLLGACKHSDNEILYEIVADV